MDDSARIVMKNLRGLALKRYGSDKKEVFYKCPESDTSMKVRCTSNQKLKDCVVPFCEACKSKKCEVFSGAIKVSSGTAAVAVGLYEVKTKTSASEALRRTLRRTIAKERRVLTTEKSKCLLSAVGAAVISNKNHITKLARRLGIPGDKITVTQLIKIGNGIYVRDAELGLQALVELTGCSLTTEELHNLDVNMKDKQVDYAELRNVLTDGQKAVSTDRDLYAQEVTMPFYVLLLIIICGVTILSIMCCAGCFACIYCACRRVKAERVDKSTQT